ncbi:MAG: hypothetical protein ACREKL_03050 [Chthoniobacterales bacterium]
MNTHLVSPSRSFWLGSVALLVCASISAYGQSFNGNAATGFGGAIGGSTLTVTENGLNFDFSLTTGTAFNANALILYIDSIPGGVDSTTTLTDTADGGRTAISGLNTGNPSRTVATFAAGFGADFAVTLEPGVFSGTFDLSNPANFGFVQGNGLVGAGTGPFTFSIARSSLGLVEGQGFSFVGTLISTSAYRSNETIGTSLTVPGSVGDTPNAGFNGTTTFAESLQVTAVPEPSTAAYLIAFGMALLIGRGLVRRRSAIQG